MTVIVNSSYAVWCMSHEQTSGISVNQNAGIGNTQVHLNLW